MKATVQRTRLIEALTPLKDLASTKSESYLNHNMLALGTHNSTLLLRTMNIVEGYYAQYTIGAVVDNQGQEDSYYPLTDLLTVLGKYTDEFVTLEIVEEELHATKDSGKRVIRVLSVRCGKSKSKLKPVDVYEHDWTFEQIPSSIDPRPWQKHIGRVLYASAKDENRPALNGVLVEVKEGELAVVAADGYRLARSVVGVTSEPNQEHVVPKRLAKFIASFKAPMRMHFEKTLVHIESGELQIRAMLITNAYPNYMTVVRGVAESEQIAFSIAEMKRAINIAGVFARDRANHIHVRSVPEGIEVLGKSSERGDSAHVIDNLADTRFDFEFGANYKFILEALAHLDDKEVAIRLAGGSTESPSWHQVRFQAENQLHLIQMMT